jgi:hypothetical protein
MKNFRYWRKMTWAILIAGAFLLVWVVVGGFSLPTIALAVGVIGVMWAVRYLTQPLWRQGRGFHRRRLQYVHVPWKTPTGPTSRSVT